MKKLLLLCGKVFFSATLVLALPVVAQSKPASTHSKEAIADHRAMAAAHEAAAKCLESGKEEKVCHAQLAKDCKNLGIGKFCGLKHKH